MDPVLRNVLNKSIFHSPETVSKNEVVSKFLIFPSIPSKTREIRVDFDSLFFEDRDAKTSFYFIKRPL